MPRQSPRPPRPVTEAGLEATALHYLERFAASAGMVRRVLMRRVDAAARAGLTERADGARLAEAVIARLLARRLIDDAGFAEMRTRSLHRRGTSTRAIRARLSAKGVGPDAVQGALDELAETVAEPELAAAAQLARRRRLGPFRLDDRAVHRQRDLAVLGRAGFDGETARRVIDAPDAAALEADLRG